METSSPPHPPNNLSTHPQGAMDGAASADAWGSAYRRTVYAEGGGFGCRTAAGGAVHSGASRGTDRGASAPFEPADLEKRLRN